MQIPLHLNRTADVNDLADNELGLQSMHEVWGWNSDSQPYWYWLVVPELPPGMPKGDIQEEATFVGYFLKLLPYEDHRGKSLATPLLIGRLIWHPSAARSAESQAWSWEWLALGAVVVLLGCAWRWRFSSRAPAPAIRGREQPRSARGRRLARRRGKRRGRARSRGRTAHVMQSLQVEPLGNSLDHPRPTMDNQP